MVRRIQWLPKNFQSLNEQIIYCADRVVTSIKLVQMLPWHESIVNGFCNTPKMLSEQGRSVNIL